MSDFTDQSEFSNQSRSNTASSFETTLKSAFSAAQRTEIANIVAAVVRTIQMQQPISSLTSAAQSTPGYNQPAEYIKE
jgi:hypothetical protein